MASAWLGSLVNANQTPLERKAKYDVCRSHGANVSHSIRMRDWRWNKIARRFGYLDRKDLFLALAIDPSGFDETPYNSEN